MSLVRLVYYSAATSDLPLTDIKQILLAARKNNAAIDICGMLCYNNQYFLQVIEGQREAISELFLTIAEDSRHEDVVLVSYDYVKERMFQDWQMGYAGSDELLSVMLAKLQLRQFDPEKLTAPQCLAILKNLSKNQQKL